MFNYKEKKMTGDAVEKKKMGTGAKVAIGCGSSEVATTTTQVAAPPPTEATVSAASSTTTQTVATTTTEPVTTTTKAPKLTVTATDYTYNGLPEAVGAGVELEFVNQRLIPNAMEPRACVAEWDAFEESMTVWTTSQNPHTIRLLLGAFTLGVPEHKLRVISPDVGGGFGSKIFHYPE